MAELTRADLMSLEEYSEQRNDFRAKVIAHKAVRKIALGPNATLYFEDRLTMQYQVQEMLRIEKIFDAEGIKEELDAYNALIPDGGNWKATFMLEFPDEAERKQWLAKLIGIERQTWVQVAGFDKVYPICNEDLERETEDKTSSVHFMRFELTSEMRDAVKNGSGISMGTEHSEYIYETNLASESLSSLAADLV